jgi:hypothetical protein
VVIAVLFLMAASGMATMAGWADPASRAQAGEAVGRMLLAWWLLNPNRPRGAPMPPPVVPTSVPGPTPISSFIRDPQPVVGPPGSDLPALTDRRVGSEAPVWRSASGLSPVDLVFNTDGPVLVGRVLVANSPAAAPSTWAKAFEVWISGTPDALHGAPVGRWELAPTAEPQEFVFSRGLARSARLRILSNYGSTEYTSLAEFALLPAAG